MLWQNILVSRIGREWVLRAKQSDPKRCKIIFLNQPALHAKHRNQDPFACSVAILITSILVTVKRPFKMQQNVLIYTKHQDSTLEAKQSSPKQRRQLIEKQSCLRELSTTSSINTMPTWHIFSLPDAAAIIRCQQKRQCLVCKPIHYVRISVCGTSVHGTKRPSCDPT